LIGLKTWSLAETDGQNKYLVDRETKRTHLCHPLLFYIINAIDEGIDIQPWQQPCTFPDGETRDVKIHFWDFGGQEILHATHQFFLTKRSLYLFVWEARKEEEIQSFDYWLNAVKLLGAESPVIMVMNKSELRIKQIA